MCVCVCVCMCVCVCVCVCVCTCVCVCVLVCVCVITVLVVTVQVVAHSLCLFVLAEECIKKICSHPRATRWIKCEQCKVWYHCLCTGVPWSKAQKDDFVWCCENC